MQLKRQHTRKSPTEMALCRTETHDVLWPFPWRPKKACRGRFEKLFILPSLNGSIHPDLLRKEQFIIRPTYTQAIARFFICHQMAKINTGNECL
ncbi:hypothetical protein CDAR_449701 [Caerostris darwini]|uniref:Uncharacterized protein n=1 Tax=Caerostris darwini TaxID=1538125 RepID=A0AAV4QWF9_9ARAC|nr:hypothetical protein CDAR_449701 [Caerostris darwini]